MNNESSLPLHEEGDIPEAASSHRSPLAGYKFSQEELEVMGECNTEAFYRRSLPLGATLAFGTYAAINRGFLRPNPRWGPYPKITLAVMLGYFIGKISYQEHCAEKLMALPGSYIGQVLREKKNAMRGGRRTTTTAPSMFGAGPGDIYSDAGPGSSLDLDTDRPLFGNDDYRPTNEDAATPGQPQAPPTNSSLTYDELRRRNRGEALLQKPDPYRVDPSNVPPIARASPPTAPSAPTNEYGDVME